MQTTVMVAKTRNELLRFINLTMPYFKVFPPASNVRKHHYISLAITPASVFNLLAFPRRTQIY